MLCCLKTVVTPTSWQWGACLLAALSAGPLGVLLILRRMTLMADGLAHGILPGFALATAWLGQLSGWSRLLGALISLSLVGLVQMMSRHVRLGVEAVFAGMIMWFMALGFWLTKGQDLHFFSGHFAHVHFGDVMIMATVCVITFAVVLFYYRDFLLSACDPDFYSRQHGSAKAIEQWLLVLITLNLWALSPMLGSLMSVAFMILPALIMRLWTNWIPGMMAGSVVLGLVATSFGMLHTGCSQGGWGVIVCLGSIFCLSCVLTPWLYEQASRIKLR